MAFVPGARRAERALEPFEEGVPDGLRSALAEWCRDQIHSHERMVLLNVEFDWGIENINRYTFELHRDRVISYYLEEQDAILDIAEYLVENMSGPSSRARLEELLEAAHSIYRVRVTEADMAYRVDPAVQTQAEQTIKAAATGTAHWLTEAWNDAYAMTPRPGPAYDAAIKAVEACLGDVVIPDSNRKSITQIIIAIRDGQNKNKFVFELEDSRGGAAGANEPVIDTIDTVLAMLRALAYGQKVRHGRSEDVTINSAEEARAAVQLAVTLVQFGLSGALRPRE